MEKDLKEQLIRLHLELRKGIQDKYKRTLPFEEELFDRWELAHFLGFGRGTSVYHNSYIYGDVEVGENTWIGPFTLLDGSGGLSIGDYCSISAGVHIYTHDSAKWAVTGGKAEYERGPVRVGNCCYIGSHTVVIRGITIGDHSIIGAGSLVNRDIPPYSIAAGSPVKVIGRVIVDQEEVRLEYF